MEYILSTAYYNTTCIRESPLLKLIMNNIIYAILGTEVITAGDAHETYCNIINIHISDIKCARTLYYIILSSKHELTVGCAVYKCTYVKKTRMVG